MGEANLILRTTIVEKSAADIAAVGACLRDEHPSIRGSLEQAGESVALAPAVLACLVVEGVARLIAGRGTCKSSHGLRLRTEECRGAVGQDKAAGLALHDAYFRFAATSTAGIDFVAKGHVAACNVEDNVENVTLVLLEMTDSFSGDNLYEALLRGAQPVFVIDGLYIAAF